MYKCSSERLIHHKHFNLYCSNKYTPFARNLSKPQRCKFITERSRTLLYWLQSCFMAAKYCQRRQASFPIYVDVKTYAIWYDFHGCVDRYFVRTNVLKQTTSSGQIRVTFYKKSVHVCWYVLGFLDRAAKWKHGHTVGFKLKYLWKKQIHMLGSHTHYDRQRATSKSHMLQAKMDRQELATVQSTLGQWEVSTVTSKEGHWYIAIVTCKDVTMIKTFMLQAKKDLW